MSASNAALVGDQRDNKPTPSANVPSAIDPVTPETAVIVSEPVPEVDQRKPAKKVARVLLLGFAAIMATHVATDLMAPSSTTGQVAAYTTMITPRVNGQVDKIDVQDNQKVKAGDVLFELDPRPFDLALRQAEVALEQATRSLASSSASLEAAQAKITQAKISLENTRANTERTRDMFSRGLSSQSVLDSANAQLASAEAGLDAAELDYQSAVIQLGGDRCEQSPADGSDGAARTGAAEQGLLCGNGAFRWGGDQHEAVGGPISERGGLGADLYRQRAALGVGGFPRDPIGQYQRRR